jgi:hypothetical protein
MMKERPAIRAAIIVTTAAVLGLLFADAALAVTGTALCKANEKVCSEGQTYGSASLVGAVEPETKTEVGLKLPSLGTVSCARSEIALGLEESGVAFGGKVTNFEFHECAFGPCVSEIAAKFPISNGLELIATEASGDGDLWTSPVEFVVAFVSCPGFSKCKYATTPSQKSQIHGGEPATLDTEWAEERLSGSGVACPSTATFFARYAVAVPGSPLYVTQ